MAEKLEDFKVWHRANELWDAVNAIIDRPGFLRNRRLTALIKYLLRSDRRDRGLAARGETPASHRDGRGASMARRDD